jgi:hypothetical protein
MQFREGEVTREIELSEKSHHSAGAFRRASDMKILDDAPFVAADSLDPVVPVCTKSLMTYPTRAVPSGKLRSASWAATRWEAGYLFDVHEPEFGDWNKDFGTILSWKTGAKLICYGTLLF